jgi:hypothetical protein
VDHLRRQGRHPGGWGHPAPPGAWDKGTTRLISIKTRSGPVTAAINTSRNCLGNGQWDAEFDSFLDDYLTGSGAEVAADFRNHDFKDDTGPRLCWQDLAPDMPVRVVGVENGEVVPHELWRVSEFGRVPPRQEFNSLAEAQKVFPELDLKNLQSKRFVGPVVGKTKGGRFRSLFFTWAVHESLSD